MFESNVSNGSDMTPVIAALSPAAETPHAPLATLQPDAGEAIRFLRTLFREGDWVHLRTKPEPADARAASNHFHQVNEHFDGYVKGFLEYCAVEQRAGYFLPGVSTPNKAGKDGVRSAFIVVDLDKEIPSKNLAAIEAKCGQATAVVETGGLVDGHKRLHAYFLTPEPSTGADIQRVCAIRLRLADGFGGDKSFRQEAQVSRLPGGYHFKNGPKLVTIRSLNAANTVSLEAVERALGSTPVAATNVLPFSLGINEVKPDGADTTRVLTQPIHEGATDDLTRFEGAGIAIGHYLREAQQGRISEPEAWERTKAWNIATLVPPWSEERLRGDYVRLRDREIKQNGAFVAPLVTTQEPRKPFSLNNWTMERYKGVAPEQKWLVQGVVPLGDPGVIAGEGGVGKSFLALDLCYRVATGKPLPKGSLDISGSDIFGGRVVEFGSAIYVTAEEDAAALHRRLNQLDPTGARSGAMDKLFVVSLRDEGGGRSLIGTERDGYQPTAYAAELLEEFRKAPDLKLVILDPLAVFCGADLNSRAVAQAFADVLSFISSATGATVIALHHMRKDSAATGERGAVHGSGGFVDALRFTYTLRLATKTEAKGHKPKFSLRDEHGELAIGELVKANGGPKGGEHVYERQPSGVLRQLPGRVDLALAAREEHRKQLVEAVDWYAEYGQPFTRTSRNGGQGLWFHKECLPLELRDLGEKALVELADEALKEGELVMAAIGKEKVQKWLCKPGSKIATGDLPAFTQGERPPWDRRDL